MTLRDAIKAQHDAAEAHPFTALLLSGSIPKETYAQYLFNHAVVFSALEDRLASAGMLVGLAGFNRAALVMRDLVELDVGGLQLCDATRACVDRIRSLDDRRLLAYVYVYHFADMFGGQIIKSKVPGSGARYAYEDRQGLIAAIRPLLGDDLSDEAQRAFAFTLELFDELAPATA